MNKRLGWVLTLTARVVLTTAVIGCAQAPQQTPTQRPTPTPTAAPTPVGETPEEIALQPCPDVAAATDPFEPGYDIAAAAVRPAEPDEEHRDPEVPPLPTNPHGSLMAVPLAEGNAPSAHDPTDPAALQVYGSHDFQSWTNWTAEPNVATHGNRALVTWNRGLAFSKDLGNTFAEVNPREYTIFENEDYGFCCDQVALYVPQHDLWLWLLQYDANQDEDDPEKVGPNRIRLGIAQGDAAFDNRSFRYVDFIPQRFGFAPRVWFDRSNLAFSDGYLFLAVNSYLGPREVVTYPGSLVVRISLSELAAGGPLTPDCMRPEYAYRTDTGGVVTYNAYSVQPVRGAADTMFLASLVDDATIAIWRWPDASSEPSLHYVRDVHPTLPDRFVRVPHDEFACPRDGVALPSTSDWCSNADYRMLAAWRSAGELGFAGNAAHVADDASFPYPSIWSVVVDEASIGNCQAGQCVKGWPWKAFRDTAVQYVALAPNAGAGVGGVALKGGGSQDISCQMMVHDQYTSADPGSDTYWELETAISSTARPPQWTGDYLGVWPDGGGERTWSGACMTMQAAGQGPVTTVHFIRFGRKLNNPTAGE